MGRYHAGRRKGSRQTPPIRAWCHGQIARGPLPTGIARAIGSGWQALHRNRTCPVSIHHNEIVSVRVSEGDRFAAPPIRLSPDSRRTHADEFKILSEIAAYYELEPRSASHHTIADSPLIIPCVRQVIFLIATGRRRTAALRLQSLRLGLSHLAG